MRQGIRGHQGLQDTKRSNGSNSEGVRRTADGRKTSFSVEYHSNEMNLLCLNRRTIERFTPRNFSHRTLPHRKVKAAAHIESEEYDANENTATH